MKPTLFPPGLFLTCIVISAPLWAQSETVKFMSFSRDTELAQRAVMLEDYGSYQWYQASQEDLDFLTRELSGDLVLINDASVLYLQNARTDTRDAAPVIPEMFRVVTLQGPALEVIQFHGPIKAEWLDQVRATGARLVHYIDRYGYLIWTDEVSRKRLKAIQSREIFLSHRQPYHPYYKLRPTLLDRLMTSDHPEDPVLVTVQILHHEQNGATRQTIERRAQRAFGPWTPLLRYENRVVQLSLTDIAELSMRPDVVWIGERFERELFDEVQGQIMAANFDVNQSGPDSPGYLAWLDAHGFSQDPAEYPIVDVTDDGIGPGTPDTQDPTLNELGAISGPSRIAFVSNCTSASNGGGVGGHGHINVSIAGGYDLRTGEPYQDVDGYQRGMGINPYGIFGGTRIFAPSFDLSACGGSDSGLILQNYQNGSAISTNSWGCSSCAGSYDDSSQAFDTGVRDADLTTPGNQELIYIFSAGNSGPSSNTIGTPGNGKNMITVGASENDRATWTDGCNVGPNGADDAMDVIDFSSRGPAPGNRAKPEIIAPGTHIQGTASTNPSYNGTSVCDQYQPTGQTVFASSSGTSHSTPAVAGLASLVYWWIQNNLTVESRRQTPTPSPALMKAYLMAHAATYLTGVDAGDDLPSPAQGFGMPDMTVCFDDAPRYLIDQSHVFDNTGETWTFNAAVADPSRPLRIALAYTDEPGAISATNPQINDLDLEVQVGADTYLGNVFSGAWSQLGGTPDPNNNYEAVFLPAGTSGSLHITVRATQVAGDGIPNQGDITDQDFAIVCYNCAQYPDFTLNVTPRITRACADSDPVFDITIGQILGYTDEVTLSVTDLPAGVTHQFSSTLITPPDTATLTLSDLNATPASTYTFHVQGTSTTGTKLFPVEITIDDIQPAAPTLTSPPDQATDVDRTPTLSWDPTPQAAEYTVDLALDSNFTQILHAYQTQQTQIVVGTNLEDLTQYFWRVQPHNACGDGAVSQTFSFTTMEQPDYMTELFDASDNDLENLTLRFEPNGMSDFYRVCREDANVLPTDPSNAMPVDLSDDDCETITLTTPISFYGTDYDEIHISSNGYVTFDSCATGYSESLSTHFGRIQVAGLFDDLNPSSAGQVSYEELTDRLVVTYESVPQYSSSDSNTFQIEFFHDGTLQITWLEIGARDGLAGLSQGLDTPPDFLENDLTAAGECQNCLGDLNADQVVDATDMSLMLPRWNSVDRSADVDQSGKVDILDAVHMHDLMGPCL